MMTNATVTNQNGAAAKPPASKAGNKSANGGSAKGKSANGSAARKITQRGKAASGNRASGRHRNSIRNLPEVPGWLAAVMSVVGVGVAVGAGLYATRKQWMPTAQDWKRDFSAAFADDETDQFNFDQTRNAGADSMRDHPGDDWDDVDDISDASFPASDPPSFNPGTA